MFIKTSFGSDEVRRKDVAAFIVVVRKTVSLLIEWHHK